MRPHMISLALAAAAISAPAAARAQFTHLDTDCRGLKLQQASGVPKYLEHRYTFRGSCKLQLHGVGGTVTTVNTFPAEAHVTWIAKDRSLVEQFTTLGAFKYQGTVMGGQVYNAFTCDDDPIINPQAACSGVEHWNHSAIDALSFPYQQFRPITKGKTTLAQATTLSGASGQQTTPAQAPPPKPNPTGPKSLSRPETAADHSTIQSSQQNAADNSKIQSSQKNAAEEHPKMLSSPKAAPPAPAHKPTMLSAPKPASLIVEGETLVASAEKSGGEVIAQDMAPFGTTWSNGAQLAWSAHQPGAFLRLVPMAGPAGHREVAIVFTMAPDYARVEVSVDGAEPVAFDGYAPSVIHARQVIGTFDFGPGPHEVLLKVTGRNPSSTGYLVGIDRLEFIRQP
jgi:hypothetical protein